MAGIANPISKSWIYIPLLLLKLRKYTSVRVNLKRVAVDPETDDLSPYPFLYLTGLDDFRFHAREVAALQRYLNYDGVLLINNGLGLSRIYWGSISAPTCALFTVPATWKPVGSTSSISRLPSVG